jgi:hypothetical protein
MAKKEIATQKLVLNVEMGEADAKRLFEGFEGREDQIPLLAAYLLTHYAQGGLMLKAEEMANLQTITKTKIVNSASITALVERALERRDGGCRVEATIDDSLMEPIRELANAMGLTVNAFVTDALNTMLTNGWLYAITPTGGTIYLTKEQHDLLKGKLGEHYTSDRILEALGCKPPLKAGIHEDPAAPQDLLAEDAVPAEV